MAKHHNIVKKPKLILPAIGSALQTGASAFGKRAGLLLANKLFGVETEGFGFKKKNKKPKMMVNKPKAKFPDLSGDGKVTQKDILIGRGVIDKPKMLVNKRKTFI